MSALHYRPDIDGLRAVAVLSVILFHAGMPHMGGGYVGVDVFFVISGFLITSLILKDLNAGTFTFAGFWERRARRILPALVFMVAGTLLAGWFLFLPGDFEALGKQVAAQAAFGSNILFYKESGYFDQGSFLKPLLHTWSLAVEEQFYIFFPLVAAFVWWKRRGGFFKFLLITAIISFALCQIVMRANEELAFYMLPFRAWELLAGALLAYRMPSLQDRFRPAVALSGIMAILLPVFLYTEKTMFPGIGALPPVLGTLAIIWAGTGGTTPVNGFLSWRPVVFVGLVSYSWYLWHWPVIVFAKYIPLYEYDETIAALCVTGSFALAVFSWRYIERPFRRFEFCASSKAMYRTSFAALSLLAVVGVALFVTKGLPQRLDKRVAQYAYGITDDNPHRDECNRRSAKDINADNVCETAKENGDPSFILWGDSQADAIAPLFYALSKEHGKNGVVVTHHGCEAIVGFHKTTWDSDFYCNEFNVAVFDMIERRNIKNVFLVSGYNSWMIQNDLNTEEVTLEGDYPQGYKTKVAAGLARTIDKLREIGANIYLVHEIPHAPFDPPRLLAMDALYGHEKRGGATREGYMHSRGVQMEIFLNKYGRKHITVIDPVVTMCPDKQCIYEHDGFSLYYNSSHLSSKGALYIAPLFVPYFEKGL